MLSHIYYEKDQILIVQYPAHLRIPAKRLTDVTPSAVQTVIQVQTLKYMHDRLTKFVNQREKAFMAMKCYAQQEKRAIQIMRSILRSTQECRLPKFVKAITDKQNTLFFLQPSKQSACYEYFIGTIFPIIHWCAEASSQYYQTPFHRQSVSR
ncbi:hypothetical protein [Sphingobacterium thalpophilum]|uniref:hypothetical protein n=1 Tax=Sphingobacterium thalpophilum TaxID=259 RepID=UPI0024A72A8C|nr:hypothetical protein [Sphingobacterium thalpophilum]